MRDLLKTLGITPNLKGYQYIIDGVELINKVPELRYKITGTEGLYGSIALLRESTPERVERAIRHAIHVGFKSGLNVAWHHYFPLDRPTNAHFLCELAEEMRLREIA